MTRYLAFDGGGTWTRAGLYDADGVLLAEAQGDPCNPVAYGLETCIAVLTSLGRQVAGDDGPEGLVVAAAVAGARETDLRDAVAHRLADGLGAARVLATDDLRPVLYANAGAAPALLVVAGTGSGVLAQGAGGPAVFVGGRGAVVGDEGSAYRLAVEGMRAAAHFLDGLGDDTTLVRDLPRAAGFDDLGGMPLWAESAGKRDIAALARVVTAAAEAGDGSARRCLLLQAELLSLQVGAAHRLAGLPPAVPVYLMGGLLLSSSLYRRLLEESLGERLPEAQAQVAPMQGHRAALEMVRAGDLPRWIPHSVATASGAAVLPPTEQAPEDRPHLDALTAIEIARHMNHEDARIAGAVEKVLPAVAEAIDTAARCLRAGGRIVYVGAGTSGRLGVLDASECPPTFGVAPDRVVGRMAGGDAAVYSGVEGAEDDTAQGRADAADLGPSDFLVGIAASGTTPYVRAALDAAREGGVPTALLCCNPAVRDGAGIVIAVDTGPEALPGSTRLKAGTATKMVLNMISTGAMALSGRVYEGYMVGMGPVNRKLRLRAARIVSALTGRDEAAAERLLEAARYRIPVAVLMARIGLEAEVAERRLETAGGDLREALRNG